jgi:hypothetical protein
MQQKHSKCMWLINVVHLDCVIKEVFHFKKKVLQDKFLTKTFAPVVKQVGDLGYHIKRPCLWCRLHVTWWWACDGMGVWLDSETRNWHNILIEKYLIKQSLGRSRIWLDTIKVDLRPQRWTQWAQDHASWRVVAFNQIRPNVKPRSKINSSSPTNFDCHENWQVYPTPVDLYSL